MHTCTTAIVLKLSASDFSSQISVVRIVDYRQSSLEVGSIIKLSFSLVVVTRWIFYRALVRWEADDVDYIVFKGNLEPEYKFLIPGIEFNRKVKVFRKGFTDR